MKLITRHPHEQGLTYFEHWAFAMGIAWRLLRTVVAFAIHAQLPAIAIERQLDLEATSAFLLERNRHVEAAAAAGREVAVGAVASRTAVGALTMSRTRLSATSSVSVVSMGRMPARIGIP